MNTERALAWSVHIFTASGLIAGFMAILAINSRDWREAMLWLLLALFIDGVDGTLARKFRVREVLINVSGKVIDIVVDFTNYALIPAYFFYSAELAGPAFSLYLTFLILLVSAVYYGKKGMVSDDFYFVGFPVMWNVVIFYLVFVFDSFLFLKTLNAAVVVIFAVLHFVPVKFAYPSRATHMKKSTTIATSAIMIIMPLTVWLYPDVPLWLKMLATINLAYFGILAVYDTFRKERAARFNEIS